jgi:signal transduction histidine kinase/ActR/RegA family two-component response regulator
MDVPGISRDEAEAIERVKASRDSLILANEPSSEMFLAEDGGMGGAGALFSEWLSGFFGIPFEPRAVEWSGILSGLEDGSVDFTADLTPTPRRIGVYFMTSPVAERPLQYITLPGSRPPSEIARGRHVRYAFLQGSEDFFHARENLEKPFVALSFKDMAEAWAALEAGEADAFIAGSTTRVAFDRYGETAAENILPPVAVDVALAARNPELAPFVAAVQKYIDGKSRAWLEDIYRRGHRDWVRKSLADSLTPGERDWLASRRGRPIIVGYESGNYPMSIYNETEGEYQGVGPDILAEISDLAGLELVAAYPYPVQWTEILTGLGEGRIEAVTELGRTPGREGKFLWTDEPYMSDRYAFLSLAGFPDCEVGDVPGLRIAIIENAAFTELFWKWFPGHRNTVAFETVEEAFDAASRGDVDLVMGTRNMAIYMASYSERPFFRENLTLKESYESYFGVSKDLPELRGILSKAQRLVDTGLVASRWRAKVFDYRGALARARVPWMAGGLALLAAAGAIIAVMFARSRRDEAALEEAVAARTEELRREIAVSARESRAKSDFLARTSHEIRTPMNAIIGFAELARREYGSLAGLEYVRGIRSAGASLLAIVNDVLDFSRIQSGSFTLAPSDYGTAGLIGRAVAAARPGLAEGVRLKTDAPPDLPSILNGDSGRVGQVLENLVSNAVKYTKSGYILVKVRAERIMATSDGGAGDAADSAEPGNGGDAERDRAMLSFEVRDTGKGIRTADLKRLFVEFTRLDERINAGREGAGLGLAISRRLCLAMGGDLEAKSVYGKGSTFRARMVQKVADWTPMGPLDGEGAASASARKPSFVAPAAEVLVVDDSASNLMVAEGLLAPYGMSVSLASGGPESVRLALERDFDLILMDLMMPEMDGGEAMRVIRSQKGRTGVRVVALTADAVLGERERFIESGFDDCLSKPIDPSLMDEILVRWIPTSKRRPMT